MNTPGAVKTIWSYGHRNPQGFDVDPKTGALWESEHGPRGGDELNVIEKGKNYGWPVATYGMNYDGTPMTPTAVTEAPGMVNPVLHWTPSIAVSGITFYRGDKFPKWKGNLFAAALAGQQLARLEVAGGKVTHQETLLRGFGRDPAGRQCAGRHAAGRVRHARPDGPPGAGVMSRVSGA